MKKLLYITANSKPENESVSKTVGREFVNRLMKRSRDYELLELDLYSEDIPEINHRYFCERAGLAAGEDYDNLSTEDQKAVDRIGVLCDQFLDMDVYVIAVPMWSAFFPSRLKRYIDCVIINGKTINITSDRVVGLLNDKERQMIYIQSSGGAYPALISDKFSHGLKYLKDTFKFLGIEYFEKIMVEGLDMESIGFDKAMGKAYKDIEKVIDKMV